MMSEPTRRWVIASPFFRTGGDRWLDDFVPAELIKRNNWVFEKNVQPLRLRDWHTRSSRCTALLDWLRYLSHAFRSARLASKQGGLITVFPQLALMASITQKLLWRDILIVAYCFNVGKQPRPWSRRVGKWAFAGVAAIVVHSRAEQVLVHKWFGVPIQKFHYLPLQKGELAVAAEPDEIQPYILAMGTANRDYATLCKAIAHSGVRTIIVAGPRSIEGLVLPANVEWRCGLALAAKATVNVVPLIDGDTASGQVTVVEALRSGPTVIATSTIGTVDYIEDGVTGLLVPPGDPAAVGQAIMTAWSDRWLRSKLSTNALSFAAQHLSDEALGAALGELLQAVQDKSVETIPRRIARSSRNKPT
jgi:hypothetical protein